MRFFINGRTAIQAALESEALGRGDEVLILTTTQGAYISSCVTATIEKICGWSRKRSAHTKMAIVIHEFGFPCLSPEIEICKDHGIPVLEDCAYALGTRMKNGGVGTVGDYAVYSLTKHVPFPFGGVLASRGPIQQKVVAAVSPAEERLLLSALRATAGQEAQWNDARCRNWEMFGQRLAAMGVRPYFCLPGNVVPGVFVARLPETGTAQVRNSGSSLQVWKARSIMAWAAFTFPSISS